MKSLNDLKARFRFCILSIFYLSIHACGLAVEDYSEPNIVGGQDVLESASGPERVSTVGLKGCTATIIAIDLILTAAHCKSSIQQGSPVVFETNISSAARRIIQIASFTIHPKYIDINTSDYDIAVAKLAQPIPAEFRPAYLFPKDLELFVNGQQVPVRQAGYGKSNHQPFGTLRMVESLIQGQNRNGTLYVKNGSTAACHGDSGGPLYHNRDGFWYTVGVTATAVTDKEGTLCLGGNQYVSVQDRFDDILTFAKELTGRDQPLPSPTQGNPDGELDSKAPDFSPNDVSGPGSFSNQLNRLTIQPGSVKENGETLTLTIDNSSGRLANSCKFEIQVLRKNAGTPTIYQLSTYYYVRISESTFFLSFNDFLAKQRDQLGAVDQVLGRYTCNL